MEDQELGSPPHTRGILPLSLMQQCLLTDHPRTRGEYFSSAHLPSECQGSPPHTRGILPISEKNRCIRGITPAHAGNTSSICKRPSTPWDHPRTRGEYCVNAIVEIIKAGSPPHTRGIPEGIATIDVELGITPAHAGNTGGHCHD